MDKEYFNVLNDNINFSLSHHDYIDLISVRANQTVRPLTLKLRMKQMKEKMNQEISLSKQKYENIIAKQADEQYYSNIFFQYKKRKNIFTNRSFLNNQKSPNTQRNFTVYSPKRGTQKFNQTGLLTPMNYSQNNKQQQFEAYLKINSQIQKQQGQLSEEMIQLLEKKICIANKLRMSSTKFGVNSYKEALKTIQVLKYKMTINKNITQNIINKCDTFLMDEKPKEQFSERTYSLFLKFLDTMQEMDDQISQYMLNYTLKNGINDQNSILEDINQMRDDAYNEKVRSFSKYHDIDQEKKRDRQKLNKCKIYF